MWTFAAVDICSVCNTGESTFEVKIELDSNDISEHPHDDMTHTGMFGFSLFLYFL